MRSTQQFSITLPNEMSGRIRRASNPVRPNSSLVPSAAPNVRFAAQGGQTGFGRDRVPTGATWSRRWLAGRMPAKVSFLAPPWTHSRGPQGDLQAVA